MDGNSVNTFESEVTKGRLNSCASATNSQSYAEQLEFTANPPREVNTNGHIYTHGIALSLEWLW